MNAVLELVELIYDAVADGSRWPAFLEACVQAIGARRATLVLLDPHGDGVNVACWHGWLDEEMELYGEQYAASDPWRVHGVQWPEGAVGTDRDLCPREEMEASIAFREFYAPRDAIHGMGGGILWTKTGQSLIAAVRGAADGPFTESEKAVLRPLMPHLKRAALLHGELGSARRQLATFTGHLDRYAHAFLLTDAERRVLYANASAREIIGSRDGLMVEEGRICVTASKLDVTFREMLGHVLANRKGGPSRLAVPRPSGKRAYRIVALRVPDSGVMPLGVAQPAVAILIVDSDAAAQPDQAVLSEFFSLTPAEARIASRLVQGRSVDEIAAETSTSVETVRTHVRHILSKTGTGRQAELISLVLRTVLFRL